MTRAPQSWLRCTRGSSAVELVLAMPILMILMFGSAEVGNYFMSEHAVQKGVRDASRYAARLPLEDLTDPDCNLTSDSAIQDKVKRVARTGDPDGIDNSRLEFWDDDTTVTLQVECTNGVYGGIYSEFPDQDAPLIRVIARVDYEPLFDFLPLVSNGLQLNATSEAAVSGA
ncbi:MAG: TadE/TadG family type IV pilus assembly protein [Sphingomicrobium sp.]